MVKPFFVIFADMLCEMIPPTQIKQVSNIPTQRGTPTMHRETNGVTHLNCALTRPNAVFHLLETKQRLFSGLRFGHRKLNTRYAKSSFPTTSSIMLMCCSLATTFFFLHSIFNQYDRNQLLLLKTHIHLIEKSSSLQRPLAHVTS